MGKIKKKIMLKILGSGGQKLDFYENLHFFRIGFNHSPFHTHSIDKIYISFERTVQELQNEYITCEF
jgi:hypothetical protein